MHNVGIDFKVKVKGKNMDKVSGSRIKIEIGMQHGIASNGMGMA